MNYLQQKKKKRFLLAVLIAMTLHHLSENFEWTRLLDYG